MCQQFGGDSYQILFHKGALYLVARNIKYDDYIFLPIQRIKSIYVLNLKFNRDSGYNLDLISRERFGIFGHKNLKPRKIVLKFNKDISDVISERIWHKSQKLKRHHDGSLTLELNVVVSDELRSWVASWMDYVEVIQPKGLLKYAK